MSHQHGCLCVECAPMTHAVCRDDPPAGTFTYGLSPVMVCFDELKSATPALRSYTSAERKEMPVHAIIADYFPDAVAALARHSKKANDKHNPGEPMHWAREKSTDHLNCAARHLMTPDAVDPDTGEIELVGAFWRCAAALQLREEARLKALGIKPLSGVIAP